MRFVFFVFTISAISMFVLAEEETTPPPRVYPVALPNYDEETATRLQILLDNSDFGPGKIDGRMGEFFRKALISYKHAHAMPKTGAVDQWMLDQVPVTYTTYTIRDEDLKLVGNVPGTRAEQAKLKWLPYASLLELDRKSTRLNSSHRCISYAVFCLKKKKNKKLLATCPRRIHRTRLTTGRTSYTYCDSASRTSRRFVRLDLVSPRAAVRRSPDCLRC